MLLSLAAAVVVLVVFSPRFVVWRGLGIPEVQIFPEVNRAGDALRQLEEPFAAITNPSNRVIERRLLFPLLGHALHLPARVYLALPVLGCLLVLTYAAGILIGRGWRTDETLAVLIVVGAGPWFFVSCGWLAYFDSWLVLALLLCGFARSRGVVASAVLFAPWIDERFLFVLPLCLLGREAIRQSDGEVRTWCAYQRDLAWIGAALLPFVLVRFGAIYLGRAQDAAAVFATAEANRAQSEWHDYAAGAWQGLRFGWVAIAGLVLGRRVASARLLGGILVAAGLALVAMFALAADYSRSAATLGPLVLAGMIVGWPQAERRRRWLAWSLAALNLAAPAVHVVNNTRVELRALPHELQAWRNPPEILRADTYNVRATLLLVEGRAAEALPLLGYALQLEPEFPPAHLNRSTAFGKLGRWPEALAAAERAVALDSTQARAWYARALARVQTGDPRGARADAERALALVPAADPLRTRVQALIETLPGRF